MDANYTHGQFGVLGALVETTILLGIKEYRVIKSIDGNADSVKSLINASSLKSQIDSRLVERLSRKYKIVGPVTFNERGASVQSPADCLLISKNIGVDTLVLLEVSYGLAAYRDRLATVSIDSIMTVYDVESGNIILKKGIESDQEFHEHRSVEQFVSQNGKLLKEDFNEAARGFASYVGRQLEVWE